MATEIENLVLRISADAAALKKELGDAGKAVDDFSTRVGSRMKSAGQSMMRVGKSMTKFITAPILAGASASVAAFASFDEAMTQSTAIIKDWGGVTREEMEQVAISLSSQGVQSATELAESYYFLASAGFSVKDSIGALPVVQQFATAGMFDMALATDLLTDAFSALGMKSGDTAEDLKQLELLGDMLVVANTKANASVEQFATSLTSKAGAALAAFEVPAEQGIAVLAALADKGVKAELAGNGLDRMLRLLSKSALDNAAAHEALGFEVFDSEGNMNNLGTIIAQLEGIMGDLSPELKASTLAMMGFDAQVQGVILPLLGTSDAILNDFIPALNGAGGATQDVAEEQMKAFSAQMKALWNQIKNVASSIGRRLIPIISWLGEKVKSLLEWFANLSDTTKNTILVIAGIVAAIGPLLIGFGGLIMSLGLASGLMGGLSIKMVFMKGVSIALAAAKGVLAIATKTLGVALKSIPYLAIAAGVIYLVKQIYDLVAGTAEYNKQAERRNKLDKKLADMKQKSQDKEVEGFGEFEGAEKVEEIQKAIAKATREVSGYKMQVEQSKRNVKELAPTWLSAGLAGRSVWNLAKEDLAAAEKRGEAQQEHLDKLKEMLHAEKTKIKLAEDAARIEEKRKETEGGVARVVYAEQIEELNKLNEKLKEQEATFGMTNSEIEVYKAQVKGASDAQLEELRVIQEENDAIEENIKKREEEKEAVEKRKAYFKDTMESMNEEIATFGMSSVELAKYKAEKEGLSEIEVAMIGIQAKVLEKMKEEQKLMKKGEQLTKSMMSEEEKFAEGKEELDKMLRMGAIDLETYTKAMEKLKKDTTVNVKFKVTGVEAVAAGSAEAAAKLEEFRALHAGGEKVDFRAQGKEILGNQNKPFVAGPKGGNGADAKEKEDLSNIEMNTRILAERIPVVVEEAGLV